MLESIKNEPKKIDLSVDLEVDQNFKGDDFESQFVSQLAIVQEEQSLKSPNSSALNRHIEWKYSITRNYDAAVEQSEAYDWYMNIQMHILERMSDQEDRSIDLGHFGTIEDHSSVSGMMQLGVIQQHIKMIQELWVGTTAGILSIEKNTSKGSM